MESLTPNLAPRVFLLLAIAVAAIGGCHLFDGVGTTPPPGQTVQSDKQRIEDPNVSQSDLNELVAGNTAFAFDMYSELRGEDGNLFFSPHSISIALAMTYAGARNDTEAQMANALHFTLPQDRLHPAFNALDLELAGRGEGAAGADGGGFRLNVVNRIWGQEDYEFLEAFLDTLAENYGAGLSLLDFVNETEASRLAINDWVAKQTEDRIKDLIPQGAIDALTRLVLTNAVYFNVAWKEPFEEDATSDGTFYLLNGSQLTVPMMRQTEHHGYASGDGYKAVELLYDGSELSMVILLPDAGRFETFESTLDSTVARNILANIESRSVQLTMPRYTFTSSFSLVEVLAALGMTDAFGGAADFSGMDGTHDLLIGDILHKAFIKVNEAGTEAAAATAVTMGATSIPEEPVVVTIDRPFIFLIRDIETGAILFLGRVLDPAG
ncbi:MAG: serpin family protein [Phycisphaerae bacterium]|nr:serpin family protein [Phycisphaerae bacterium]